MSRMTGRDDRLDGLPARLTYDDLLLLPEDGLRHELIDGEHYVSPSPNVRHQRIAGRLFLALGSWLEEHPVGEVFIAALDVVFDPHNVVVPDVLFVSATRPELVVERHVRGADLVIEVLSPSSHRRDETLKRGLYEREGVKEYWIVDPEHDRIRVFVREGKTFGAPVTLSAERDQQLTTSLIPEFQLPLRRLFR